MIVTIDGPAGTGKSTVARRASEILGFQFLDTGAMYRTVAHLVLESGHDPQDARAAAEAARSIDMSFDGLRCFACGSEVTQLIRSELVTESASIVAQHADVREALVSEQRRLAACSNIVCEGRDQGTIVFPNAECKFFLTADPAIRAERRMKELVEDGVTVDFETLLRQIEERDRRDAERPIAPLKPADDALIIDTGPLSQEEVTEQIVDRVRSRMA
ncbi:MAG: (d)CMP kinase [Planctomycetaceae bacterium]|nr:(d)CMP kinase [Planctomycetaceae bacterium]MCB9950650.1 (d)CMP kinase [Planctomycetaceae bacterium]